MNNKYVRDLWVRLTLQLYSWTFIHNLASWVQRILTPVYTTARADYINGSSNVTTMIINLHGDSASREHYKCRRVGEKL